MSSLSPVNFLNSKPIRRLCSGIATGGALLRADARIVFICGATSTSRWTSNREILLKYADRHLDHFRFFRAEEVFEALGGSASQDLLTIEDNLGRYSDCIIIVCESESAFSELGAFALSEALVEQLLVINDKNFKKSLSFINLGPIKKCDTRSRFKPTIYSDFNAILKSIPDLEDRLFKIPHTNRKRIRTAGQSFNSISSKERLLLIADIINLLGPISISELVGVFKTFFISKSIKLETELALAISLKMISSLRSKDGNIYYFHSLERDNHFFDYNGINRISLRSEMIRLYMQSDRSRISELSSRRIENA